MNVRTHRSRLAVLLAAVAVVGLLAAVAGASAHAPNRGFVTQQAAGWGLTSSIADGATLAAPVRWSAEPVGTPPGGLDRIEFLVDGKLLWVERHAPFDFNNDNNYLYPYLFARGPHELIARGVSTTGEQVTATAHVQMTQAPPKIPRALQASWRHLVSQAVIDRGSSPGDPPLGGGVYRVRLGADGREFASPPKPVVGGYYAFSATADGVLDLGGPVNWFTAQSSYEGICHGDQTLGIYRWKIAHRALTLKVVKDPCRQRAAVMAGRWTR
jgi:hypothetical protein